MWPRCLSSRREMLGLLEAMLILPGQASAQSAAYPSRPVRLLVPFPPGGAIDLLSRVLSEELALRIGQPVVVENRAGAGGNVAAEALARSAPITGGPLPSTHIYLAIVPRRHSGAASAGLS